MILCDDEHRIAELDQNFETASRQLELALDGLIRIGHPAQSDSLGLPASRSQGLAKQPRRLFLDEYFRFKIEPSPKPKILMCRPRITINTSMFATAVGVDTRLKPTSGLLFSAIIERELSLRNCVVGWTRSSGEDFVFLTVNPLESIPWIRRGPPASQRLRQVSSCPHPTRSPIRLPREPQRSRNRSPDREYP